MKIDLYTKSVLTVIAAALLWLGVQNAFNPKPVSAQDRVKVIIAGIDALVSNELPVKLVGGTKYGTLSVNKDNPLPVSVIGE
jgi:hypothetical protein